MERRRLQASRPQPPPLRGTAVGRGAEAAAEGEVEVDPRVEALAAGGEELGAGFEGLALGLEDGEVVGEAGEVAVEGEVERRAGLCRRLLERRLALGEEALAGQRLLDLGEGGERGGAPGGEGLGAAGLRQVDGGGEAAAVDDRLQEAGGE
ncbi:MAG TPA: hypothetical protein VF100_11375, partial [Thermoanaerobaculia bacterium]